MRIALFGFTKFFLKINMVDTCALSAGRLVLKVFVLILLTLSPLPALGADPWPTTQFKVFSGNPFVGSNLIDDVIGFGWVELEDLYGPGPESIEDIERALSEAAVWYQKKGFPAPILEPLINTEDGPAYQVFVCSEEWDRAITDTFSNILVNITGLSLRWGQCVANSSGSYLTECGNDPTRTKIIVINSEISLDDNGELNEVAYQTIAHELMHAIMANTPLGRADPSCTTGHWITEGIPDAISFDIAEELWKTRYFSDNSDSALVKRYGYRPYSVRLPESRRSVFVPGIGAYDFKYTASSFWRFIADLHPDRWGVLVTSEKPNAPKGLLDTTMSGPYDWRGETTWLNTGLKGRFNRSLAEIYGLFVNNIAYRIPPMKSYRGRPAEDNIEKWAEKLFGNCAMVDLSSTPIQTITMDLARLASACIWVEPTGVSGFVQVSFQSKSEDKSLLKDISIGQPETMLVVKASPIARAPPSQSGFLASWLGFPQDGSKRTLYVVSNAAAEPTNTKPREITLTVSRPTNTNSAFATVPLPPSRIAKRPQKPSYDKHARSLVQQKRATAKMIAEQMDLDKKSLNTNVNVATRISRRLNRRDCAEPFKYAVCGPHMVIGLDIVPGSYLAPGTVAAQGGMAAQAFAGLQAMSQTSIWDSEPVAKELAARIDAIDGSSVTIIIPLIDYGFSGSFSNASISVDMSGGRTWRAFEAPDENQMTKLSGLVTIDEYMPFVISGRFSAPLAEFVPDQSGNAVYTRRQTVSGTFSSVAPWLVDERVEIILDSLEEMADDIANTMGVPVNMINSMKQAGTMPGSTSTGSGSASGGSAGATKCTCECSMKQFADELCELLCEDEFAKCESP